MHHIIGGRRYAIVLNARLGDSHGVCTDPELPGATIRIDKDLTAAELLEALIHEALHASAYQLLSEDWVSEAGHDIATLLLRLGYTRHG